MVDVTHRLAAPSLAFDLPAEIHALRRAAASHKGNVGRTLVKEPDFRLVLTVIKAGYRCERHRTSANLSVQTIAGRIRVHTPGKVFDLGAGHLVALERDIPHDVEGVEDSAFLLTIAWPRAT